MKFTPTKLAAAFLVEADARADERGVLARVRIVDLRVGSPTFARWRGFELTAERPSALCVPAGFAHSFQCVVDGCDLYCMMGESYVAELARGIRSDDPDVGVAWPLRDPFRSDRDRSLPVLREAFA